MSETPWAVRRTKRKTPSTAPSSGKRVRISNDVDERPTTGRKRQQSTLTQIQFVGTPQPSFEDADDFLEIPSGINETSSKRRKKRQTRDSTLTQMDWLARPMPTESFMDDSMIEPPQRESTHRDHVMQVSDTNGGTEVAQRRSAPAKGKRTGIQHPAEQDKNERAQTPSRRQLEATKGQTDSIGSRRRSRRLASRHSEIPDSNGSQRTPSKRPTATTNQVPKLEIADTYDCGSLHIQVVADESNMQPVTPRKNVIPSSQSPESLRTIKRTINKMQAYQSPTMQVRSPLAERSVNILSPLKRHDKEVMQSPMPKAHDYKALGLLSSKRNSRAEDLQSGGFAPTLLSPQRSSKRRLRQTQQPQPQPQLNMTESLEIPASSQNHTREDARSSAQNSPYTVIHNKSFRGNTPPMTTHSLDQRASRSDQNSQNARPDRFDLVAAVDQGHRATAEIPDSADESEEMLLDQEMHYDRASIDNEADSDLGSPIANDTQFNRDLLQKLSSPLSLGKKSSLQGDTKIVLESNAMRSEAGYTRSTSRVAHAEIPEDVLPLPKLVALPRPTGPAFDSEHETIPTEPVSPPRFGRVHSPGITTTQIPLNDTVQSSSSPLPLPASSFIHATAQTRIQPASIPRPSQISTQDPTQGQLLSTAPGPTQWEGDGSDSTDRITIKDSSPSPWRISQVPAHEGRTQTQVKTRTVIDDSEDEAEDDDLDLDLDPQSGSRHSARKPTLSRLSSKTDSSLRSIHASLTAIAKHNLHHLSSSPPLPEITQSESGSGGKTPKPTNSLQALLENISSSSTASSPSRQDLDRLAAIAGFDNDTQSNFTQNGHVSAAYINRMKREGLLPSWFTPKPYQLKGTRGENEDEEEDEL